MNDGGAGHGMAYVVYVYSEVVVVEVQFDKFKLAATIRGVKLDRVCLSQSGKSSIASPHFQVKSTYTCG